jgi:hypothetical protein
MSLSASVEDLPLKQIVKQYELEGRALTRELPQVNLVRERNLIIKGLRKAFLEFFG